MCCTVSASNSSFVVNSFLDCKMVSLEGRDIATTQATTHVFLPPISQAMSVTESSGISSMDPLTQLFEAQECWPLQS
jgi:hypothetical protein